MRTESKPSKQPRRAFSGIAGSPLAKVDEAVVASNTAGPPLVLPDTITLLRQTVISKHLKAAKYQRDRRKREAEQLVAIKRKLRTPIAEIKAAAEQQAKADKQLRSGTSTNRGSYMPGAPTGKGQIVTGGFTSKKLESIAAARGGSAVLGSPDEDPETGEAFWSDNDRRIVKAQGDGASSDDKPEATGGAHKDEPAPQKFQVKLNNFDWAQMMEDVFSKYFVKIAPNEPGYDAEFGIADESQYICRLCGMRVDWKRTAKNHMENVHGDEREPTHDNRFGNVIRKFKYTPRRKRQPTVSQALTG